MSAVRNTKMQVVVVVVTLTLKGMLKNQVVQTKWHLLTKTLLKHRAKTEHRKFNKSKLNEATEQPNTHSKY